MARSPALRAPFDSRADSLLVKLLWLGGAAGSFPLPDLAGRGGRAPKGASRVRGESQRLPLTRPSLRSGHPLPARAGRGYRRNRGAVVGANSESALIQQPWIVHLPTANRRRALAVDPRA